MLNAAIQNVDPELLWTRLFESLWHLHGQPPLWNGLVGVSLKVAPVHWAELWHLVFLGLGLVEVLALFALLEELRLPRRAAFAIAAAFSLSPAVLVYENSFFYDYPTLVVLTLTALGVARFVSHPSLGRGLPVFAGAAFLVLTRTLFQVWWLLALLALLLVACRGGRRVVLLACALPLALVLGVYAKNWFMYGVPSTTSWTGMGFARAAVEGVPLGERRKLVAEGKLHAVSLVRPFAPLAAYEAVGVERARPTGIPLLDEAAGSEYPRNLENRTYIEISRDYWKDDLWIIRHRTGLYLRSVRSGAADFFSAPTEGWRGAGNVSKVSAYDRWFAEVVYGRFGLGKVGLLLIAAYAFALLVGLATAARRLRPGADAASVAVVFAAMTILYVTVVGNLAEVGENYRFAFVLQPLVWGLVAFGVHALLASRARSSE